MQTEETVWFLEMRDPAALRAPMGEGPLVEIRKSGIPCVALNWFFYCTVGKPWNWTDRFQWTAGQWHEYVHNPMVETWIGYVDGTPVGYAEIMGTPNEDVSIESFGLLPQFVGQGIGGRFLAKSIEAAWARPARRVWLHTCSFDHPNALANYKARGFTHYDTVKQMKVFPDGPITPPF